MSYTVREVANEMFRELGLADYDFDLDPEELQTAVTRMRGLVGRWELKFGIHLGFNFAGDLDDDSGLSDASAEAVWLNLAVQVSPGFGKTLKPETKQNAKDALDGLLTIAAQPKSLQQPRTLPRGAGARPWGNTYRPFNVPPTDDQLPVGAGDSINFES